MWGLEDTGRCGSALARSTTDGADVTTGLVGGCPGQGLAARTAVQTAAVTEGRKFCGSGRRGSVCWRAGCCRAVRDGSEYKSVVTTVQGHGRDGAAWEWVRTKPGNHGQDELALRLGGS